MIIKSPNDKREYQHIRLPNELDVILVKDVNTKVSAASLKICVGMLDDPRETQGIAHFLEHMLFMGSQKYPSQNEYSQYIQQNAGSTNASTSLQGTQYYFSIASDAFEKGLDIFAQFFIAPLFIQDCVEREMQAVESEFQLSLADDDQRLWEIFRMQADQNSSFNTFGCGNLKTLSKPTIRDDLIQFYQKYYSANLMKLVIYHNQDTQQLVSQIFSEIPNNRFPKPQHLDNPFNKYKQLIEIQGIKQEDQLYVSFIQKNYKSYYKYKPQEYITHLLGTEGRNSLVSFLLDEGLITELTCGTQEINDATSELYIQIVLTEDGRIECDQVLAHLFKYIQLIKEQGVQQWIFDEIRIIEEIKFQYKEKSNPEGYVGQLSSKMHKYPIEDVIYGPYQYEKFDALLIQEVLDQININNANIYVKGNEFEKSKLKWEVEPWCQTKYRKSDFSKDLQNIWNNCQNAKGKLSDKIIGIPFKNPYIPQNFDIYPGTQKYPELLVDNEFQKLYFLHDSKFQICKTCVGIVIYPNQEFVVDPKQRKLADLWGEALSHYFNEQSYEAESASVELSITMGYNKIIIEIKGFSDSVSRFTQDFIQYLNNFENLPIKEHIFEVLLDDLDDRYENYFLKSPYDLLFSYLKCNLYEKGKFMKEQLKDIDITFSEFNKFKQTFLNQVFMDIYVHGNILPQQAINLIQLKRQQNKQVQPLRILHIDDNKIFKTILENPDEPNAGLITYIQGNHTKDPVVDLQHELLNQLISDPAENQLRTNEQLGYVAYTQNMNRRGTIGLIFVIVSQVKTPDYLSTRVKAFINQFIGEIQNLSQEEFNKAKQALIQRKEQDYESTVRQFQTFFSEIKNHTYDFQQKDLVRQRLESINYGDFINFVIGFLQKPSLEIQIINPKMEQQLSTGKINGNYLDDLFGY